MQQPSLCVHTNDAPWELQCVRHWDTGPNYSANHVDVGFALQVMCGALEQLLRSVGCTPLPYQLLCGWYDVQCRRAAHVCRVCQWQFQNLNQMPTPGRLPVATRQQPAKYLRGLQ